MSWNCGQWPDLNCSFQDVADHFMKWLCFVLAVLLIILSLYLGIVIHKGTKYIIIAEVERVVSRGGESCFYGVGFLLPTDIYWFW